MQTHIIENGAVINTVMATVAQAQTAFPGAVCIDATAGGIGWTWDGSVLTAPAVDRAVTVPQSVDMAQARLALLGAGIYASAVDALIAAMPSPQREAAQIEWEFRSTVRRGSDLVLAMAAALQLTDRQVDDLFTLAATL